MLGLNYQKKKNKTHIRMMLGIMIHDFKVELNEILVRILKKLRSIP